MVKILNRAREMVSNALFSRSRFLEWAMEGNCKRDINDACGYPATIQKEQYREMYDREGIGTRVVDILPDECWAMPPEILENDSEELTPFEKAWLDLDKRIHLNHYFHRIDQLSGIGAYGILVLGLDDGKALSEPVDEYDPDTEKYKEAGSVKLLYLRTFDHAACDIAEFETDKTSPRYGRPKYYNVTFFDPNNEDVGGAGQNHTVQKVHWHRAIHIADNRKTSEVFGAPRLRAVYNKILDIRKILGGSAEMLWQGGFPGIAFEVNPDIVDPEMDEDKLRKEFEAYSNSMQRYLAIVGVGAKSLAPQVASPEFHIQGQLQGICISINVPLRIFMGSEESKLSSTQDARTWNKRLARRQRYYITPMLITPIIERLWQIGCLPRPADYTVRWPDLNTPTDEDKATVAAKRMEALQKYVVGGVDNIIPPYEALVYIMDIPEKIARKMVDAADKRIDGEETYADDDIARTPVPPKPATGTPASRAPAGSKIAKRASA